MWNQISSAPEGKAVMTKIDDDEGVRNEQVMVRRGRMWFTSNTYIYYTPTHWRELTQVEKLKIKNENERKAIDQLERANAVLGLE